MKISGFTMVKNATKLYYPIKESIESILPIVDEFVVALGDCDADDKTLEEINSIQSSKIKIIHTVWDLKKYSRGTENAHQTDLAKEHCKGDWLFYLQADEVVHENDLAIIKERCESLLNDTEVEGILFKYIHFWGDYDHRLISHGWYGHEIRIVRNRKDIHSWESAQSFRRIPDFDGKDYRQQENTFKLKVADINASIYHYGWVRPPQLMQNKNKALNTIHKGEKAVEAEYKNRSEVYDYGLLKRMPLFKETHPAVMKNMIARFNWGHLLNYTNKELDPSREKHKHDKIKYRFLTFLEQKLLGGKPLFSFKNYILIKKGK